jgi:hypothetical protein
MSIVSKELRRIGSPLPLIRDTAIADIEGGLGFNPDESPMLIRLQSRVAMECIPLIRNSPSFREVRKNAPNC